MIKTIKGHETVAVEIIEEDPIKKIIRLVDELIGDVNSARYSMQDFRAEMKQEFKELKEVTTDSFGRLRKATKEVRECLEDLGEDLDVTSNIK